MNALRSRVPNDKPASPYVLARARGKRQRSEASARVGLADFRGHDLRRTAASRMASAGVQRLVIAKVLNHVERGVTAVYDRHTYDEEKRSALDSWARILEAILARNRRARIDAERLVDRLRRTETAGRKWGGSLGSVLFIAVQYGSGGVAVDPRGVVA